MDTEHHSSAPGNLCPQGMGTVLIPGALQGGRSSFHTQSLQGIPGHPGSWSSKWLLSGKTTTMVTTCMETGGIKPAVPLGTLLQNWIFFLLLEFPYPAGQQGTFYLLDPPSLGLKWALLDLEASTAALLRQGLNFIISLCHSSSKVPASAGKHIYLKC